MIAVEELKPDLSTPFPNVPEFFKDPKTGILIPKDPVKNLVWRDKLLTQAETDLVLRQDLYNAASQSLLFCINMFFWTYHQFDVNPETGERFNAVSPHVPFITWEIQDDMFDQFEEHLRLGKDILVAKCRDMGASWCCIAFMHWLWLFKGDAQLLEMSRTREYVDQTGNMKTLFQKHDYLNQWLPSWMRPESALPNGKHRTNMHMLNENNGACLDGESTTKHAGSGDRRTVLLLDEFAKVENGAAMRSATRDVALMRIINSTPAGPGTEYAKWRHSGQVKVFSMPFWEHPEKGANRYAKKKTDGSWEIRSPWFNHEETVRSPREMAQEVLMNDTNAGDLFFTPYNVELHKALYACPPKTRFNIDLNENLPNAQVKNAIHAAEYSSIKIHQAKAGSLRVWTNLILGRPDQSKTYVFGIDISKGHGASNSVVSIKCKETGEKIAEWRDANTPPYDFARVVVALAIWCGGNNRKHLPFLKWEQNGPGHDFGRLLVMEYNYPYYYSHISENMKSRKKTKSYGWHSSPVDKEMLLALYDRVLAFGGYINHSEWGLDELSMYIHYSGGGIGPAELMEENASARETHGDVVIADALTLDDSEVPRSPIQKTRVPANSIAGRRQALLSKRGKKKGWKQSFNFGN